MNSSLAPFQLFSSGDGGSKRFRHTVVQPLDVDGTKGRLAGPSQVARFPMLLARITSFPRNAVMFPLILDTTLKRSIA